MNNRGMLGVIVGGVRHPRLVHLKLVGKENFNVARLIRQIFNSDVANKNIFFVINQIFKLQLHAESRMASRRPADGSIFLRRHLDLPLGGLGPGELASHPDPNAVYQLTAHMIFEPNIGIIKIAHLSSGVEINEDLAVA